jgi:hypothetical protein
MADQDLRQEEGASASIKILRNATGQLVVHLPSRLEPVTDARVARCFPWSLPDAYISILDKDNKELILLKSLDDLEGQNREIIRRELREKVFNPQIRRFVKYKNEFGVVSITAETDRGEVTFQVRSRDDIRLLSEKRALFRDADGNTYELAELDALDASSRKWVEDYF